MASKKILVVFGSTGNQGGSVIDVVLSQRDFAEKYHLRGISRDATSKKSQNLISKGVDIVQADINDSASILAALRGAYGVFAMTDYWSLLDKEKEIAQGKAIVDACKTVGVQHLIWSSLPNVSKLSDGEFTGVAHFDSKAAVEEYAEAKKGNMIVSHFMPAMFMDIVKQLTQRHDNNQLSIALPFPDLEVPWPLLSPSRDTGKFVVGLFEGGESANGAKVQGTSAWVTPNEVVKTIQEVTGHSATFESVDVKSYESSLPQEVRTDMSEMMQWIGKSSYYGKGSKAKQAESDEWLAHGTKTISWSEFVKLEYD